MKSKIVEPFASDEENLVLSGGYLKFKPTMLTDGQHIPLDLMGEWNHMDDFDHNNKRLDCRNCEKDRTESMPREILNEQIQNKGRSKLQPCP